MRTSDWSLETYVCVLHRTLSFPGRYDCLLRSMVDWNLEAEVESGQNFTHGRAYFTFGDDEEGRVNSAGNSDSRTFHAP